MKKLSGKLVMLFASMVALLAFGTAVYATTGESKPAEYINKSYTYTQYPATGGVMVTGTTYSTDYGYSSNFAYFTDAFLFVKVTSVNTDTGVIIIQPQVAVDSANYIDMRDIKPYTVTLSAGASQSFYMPLTLDGTLMRFKVVKSGVAWASVDMKVRAIDK